MENNVSGQSFGLLGSFVMRGEETLAQSSTPTAHLRFIQRGEKRILQQEWCVEMWAANGNRSMSRDWRDVPLVEVDPEAQS